MERLSLPGFVNAHSHTFQRSLRGRVEGDGVVISVEDEGEGIPVAHQDKIFERFYQVNQSSTREAEGAGLGLYLCRRLAEAMHARLWLERSDERGSVFSLWIPRTRPDEGNGAADNELERVELVPSPSVAS